jgi:O-antigen ligase
MVAYIQKEKIKKRSIMCIEQMKLSMAIYVDIWNGALRIIGKNPLPGVGTGGYQTALRNIDGDPNVPLMAHPHNNFLYIAASFGAVGLAVFLWSWSWEFQTAGGRERQLKAILCFPFSWQWFLQIFIIHRSWTWARHF